MRICFTGHRPIQLCGYDKKRYTDLIFQLYNILDHLYTEGYTEFISGGAQGFDQLAFWAVNNLKHNPNCFDVKNLLYLPYYNYGNRWAEKGLFSQKDLSKIKGLADKTNILFDTPKNKNSVIARLMDRNEAMVNDSDLVVALCNETKLTAKGGTVQCMHYAVHNHKPVIQLFYEVTDVIRIVDIKRLTDNGYENVPELIALI